MLTHPQSDLGQVKDLPSRHPSHRRQRQIPTTALAGHRPVHHDLVRVGHLRQVRTRHAGLLARRPPTTTPLPPRRGRLAKPVRRRWPGGIRGILAQATLQLDDPGLQRDIGRHQPGVGLPQLVDHHRLDRDGGLQIQIGEEITASWTTSGHARLPMGRVHSYISDRPAVKPATAAQP
jgi:hypothetical protein